MFDFLFGWRKASKCKNLVKRAQCRLKFLKIRRQSIVKQLRDDIAQLLKNAHNETAFSRVEQLFKDESLLSAYDLLSYYCEFILIHFSYIRRHKDCPNDINEAVSTLIFAASRCGDLSELKRVQKLFGERYGQRFATAAVQLYPGTLVNRQIREKLRIKPIPDYVKLRMMNEIAKDYGLRIGNMEDEVEEFQVNSHKFGGASLLVFNFTENQKFICHQFSHQRKCRKPLCKCGRVKDDLDFNCSLEHPCYYSVMETEEVSDYSVFSKFEYSKRRTMSHVHPKLPDYDELAAKFMALKKEYQEKFSTRNRSLNVMQN